MTDRRAVIYSVSCQCNKWMPNWYGTFLIGGFVYVCVHEPYGVWNSKLEEGDSNWRFRSVIDPRWDSWCQVRQGSIIVCSNWVWPQKGGSWKRMFTISVVDKSRHFIHFDNFLRTLWIIPNASVSLGHFARPLSLHQRTLILFATCQHQLHETEKKRRQWKMDCKMAS